VPLRRHLVQFVLLACALLIAATPTPAPQVAPQPAPTLFGPTQPTILIYPFEAPSDLDPKYGAAIAQIYGQVLAQSGGMRILAIPTTPIRRVDYGTYAHIQKADYYVSGYIQPIGQTAAIVSQVVDVANNITVYSATTQVTDVQDIASQALNTRSVIMQAAGIDHPQVAESQDQGSTPAPQSTGNGAAVSVTNVLGDIFKGKKGDKVADETPAPAKPTRGVIVTHLIGNAQTNVLTSGNDALYRAFTVHYSATPSTVAATDMKSQTNTICGTNRDNTIAAGTLDVQHIGGFRAHDTYTFTLDVYACYGAVLYSTTQTDDNYAKAIKEAVEQYYTDHPENNG
jgi:hypothetical protein